jgi:5-methylthioadenosine/S-adenosylhomocysteine deaminase
VSDETFVKLRQLAEQHELQMHCHIHETQFEVDESVKQFGMRPLERLNKLGLLNERMMAVHMVHLTEAEIEMLAAQKVHLVHNPNSNLKLASGVQPLKALEAAGVNTILGTDGAASNNRQDMFGEIRAAALLAKGVTGDPLTVSARTALEMATIRAAKAMGREADLGSLEPGKLADVVAVSLDALECRPVYHADAQLVYVAGREHVSDVWVGGRQLLKQRELTSIDVPALLARTEAIVERMKTER